LPRHWCGEVRQWVIGVAGRGGFEQEKETKINDNAKNEINILCRMLPPVQFLQGRPGTLSGIVHDFPIGNRQFH
jgi:hypothetical protein